MRRLAYSLLFLIFALPLGSISGPANADGFSLRITLWRTQSETDGPHRADAPLVAHFVPDQGASFVLDRSTTPPLLRFEDSPEIWILQPQPAPRGDTIYRNDIGQPMLRATKLGGLTLFTADNPAGAAAAFDGEAVSLRPPALMPPGVLFQHLLQAGDRWSRAAQKRIPFSTVDDATPQTAALVAESAIVTAEAFGRVSHMVNGRTALARIGRVMLARGHNPDAKLSGGALTITYSPDNSSGQWPSSERIVQIITK